MQKCKSSETIKSAKFCILISANCKTDCKFNLDLTFWLHSDVHKYCSVGKFQALKVAIKVLVTVVRWKTVINEGRVQNLLFCKHKYLLKNTVFYPILSLRGRIFDFWDSLFGQVKNIALCQKKYHKNVQQLCLVTHSFAQLSQNVCLINTHILINWYARCNCKIWKVLWFYSIFLVFSHIIYEHSCLKCCIYTKL